LFRELRYADFPIQERKVSCFGNSATRISRNSVTPPKELYERIHSCSLHIDIKNGKIWIQHNGTEDHIAYDLVAKGVLRILSTRDFIFHQLIVQYKKNRYPVKIQLTMVIATFKIKKLNFLLKPKCIGLC
jgi:hypothetical protein